MTVYIKHPVIFTVLLYVHLKRINLFAQTERRKRLKVAHLSAFNVKKSFPLKWRLDRHKQVHLKVKVDKLRLIGIAKDLNLSNRKVLKVLIHFRTSYGRHSVIQSGGIANSPGLNQERRYSLNDNGGSNLNSSRRSTDRSSKDRTSVKGSSRR